MSVTHSISEHHLRKRRLLKYLDDLLDENVAPLDLSCKISEEEPAINRQTSLESLSTVPENAIQAAAANNIYKQSNDFVVKLDVLENWEVYVCQPLTNLENKTEPPKELHDYALKDENSKDAMQLNKLRCVQKMRSSKRIKTKQQFTKKRATMKGKINGHMSAGEDGLVVIGPNGTAVAKSDLQSFNGMQGSVIVRKLLMLVFGRKTLASHTLTGKPSPVFQRANTPAKSKLDASKVGDIIYFMKQHSNISEKDVKYIITKKCADESKQVRKSEKSHNEL